jgi:hypothetical protein
MAYKPKARMGIPDFDFEDIGDIVRALHSRDEVPNSAEAQEVPNFETDTDRPGQAKHDAASTRAENWDLMVPVQVQDSEEGSSRSGRPDLTYNEGHHRTEDQSSDQEKNTGEDLLSLSNHSSSSPTSGRGRKRQRSDLENTPNHPDSESHGKFTFCQ